ncbi:efflux RND transporter periplasmic adaptor subunit [Selenomonas bovis]|uniref:efflux RND transporter periplasmic adaptor subunit n=1 Tax=Selenomonas bovis TaxID=416586 RepID=UPI00036FEF87|nr:efflux RND transporter periplasmic adaptor subunit [Selenomonas bovis]MCI6170624.1 efflux RND transporter periplasmic adaptor subunit [Selenomonas bovis]MCI7057443.1 efflux RND transporter periplasmic adaptor subunit [Selenomonas bovis]
MKLNWKLKAGVLAVLLAGCAFGGWHYYTAQQAAKQAAAVETTPVIRMDIKSTVSATGTIRPVDSVEVSSKITARLKTVEVKENDEVKAGQVVATLDAKDYAAKRDQAQYKVTNTQAEYERIRYLYSIGADTEKQLEDAQMNYDTAVSALSQAESDASETNILAPMDGTVVGEPKTVGTMAVATSDNPTVIMRIADLSTKKIMAKVDETDIGSVKVGQSATFTVDAYTDKTFTARVTKISQTDTANTWDTSTSSSSASTSSSAAVIYYYVTLEVDDPENLLLPAMTARVEINTADKPDALVVPISTLKTDANGSYVIVRNPDGSQENRYVQAGIYSDDYVEIVDGLSEGEEVVSTYTAKKSSSSSKSSSHGGPGGPPM